MLRNLFNALSHSKSMQKCTHSFGPARRISRRFIAGETLEDALRVVRDLNNAGMCATLNHLGETVENREAAYHGAAAYLEVLEGVHKEGLNATVSVKPSHLGLTFGEDFFLERMIEVMEGARRFGLDVEMDMEDSGTTDSTLRVFNALLDDHDNLRLALQASLFRTRDDLAQLISRGSSVRLVKGAYKEPGTAAWLKKEEVDRSYNECVDASLAFKAQMAGFYPAFGTHDHRIIETIQALAEKRGIPKEGYEFQMLLGIRRDWQERLAGEGYGVRIYVPFGTQWYPYFMRRLAERPANVLFMARAMAGK